MRLLWGWAADKASGRGTRRQAAGGRTALSLCIYRPSPMLASLRLRGGNVINLMEALRRSAGAAAEPARPAKKSRKAVNKGTALAGMNCRSGLRESAACAVPPPSPPKCPKAGLRSRFRE
jgi:hypothetical protein